MMLSLKKAFDRFSEHPFLFMWSSLLYIGFQLLYILSAVGVFLIYFFFASVMGLNTGVDEIQTIAAAAFVVILFLFFSSGLNAGLANAYNNSLENKKTALADFFRYSLGRSPVLFAIMLLREVVFLMIVGPIIALYIFVLNEYEYMDALTGIVALTLTFLIHLVFTPALIYAGAFGMEVFGAMRSGFRLLRTKHVYFLGLYLIFAPVWLLSFIPVIQIITLFALYPISYSSMIAMLEKERNR
jgi:hypothetical protein